MYETFINFIMLENHPCLLFGYDFAYKRQLLNQIEI